MKITASIVLFNSDSLIILALVNDLLLQGVEQVYLVDNSPSNNQSDYLNDAKIEYLHNPSNPGFGAAHNIAINLSIKAGANFHFVVNPDIRLGDDVINSMVDYMKQNEDVGLMMPQILNTDHSIQYLPKLLPTPWSIVRRKFKLASQSYQKFLDNYELRSAPKQIYNCPIISGCFSLLNLKAVTQLGSFDERFFMYFEDFDLSRRMHVAYQTIYYPFVHVIHGYDSGANKNFKLLFEFISSAITYFNKWGWFFDNERDSINLKTLSQFQS
jgi:GT2 family glycosyltransferase